MGFHGGFRFARHFRGVLFLRLLFFQTFHFHKQGICRTAGIFDQTVCLQPRALRFLFALFNCLFVFSFRLCTDFFNFSLELQRLCFFLLHFGAGGLQSIDHILEPSVFCGNLRLCRRNDFRTKPQPLRNDKSIGTSGNSNQQFISRTERFHGEFTGSVFHTVGRQCIFFQLGIMRCGGKLCPFTAKRL